MSPNLYRHPCARLLSYAAAPLLLLSQAASPAQTVNAHRTRMMDANAWLAKYGTAYCNPCGFTGYPYQLYYAGANYSSPEQVKVVFTYNYYGYTYTYNTLAPLGSSYHLSGAATLGQLMDAPFTAAWNTLRNSGPGPDADGDGLLDKWEQLAWPNHVLTLHGKHDDEDNDGITNLAEFRRATSPVWKDVDYEDAGTVSPAGNLLIYPGANGLPDAWETALWLKNPTVAAARNELPLIGRYPLPPVTFYPSDMDSDGLQDWWEVQHFGGRSQPEAAYAADPDGDGVPNWLEYLFGTPPMNPVNCPEDPALADPLEILSCRLTGTSWGMGALGWTGAPRWVHEAGADTDADTLPDLWEIHQSWKKGTLPANATIAQRLAEWQAAGDPDSDSYPNWLEFRLGSPAFSAVNYPADTAVASPLDALAMRACGLPWNPGSMGLVPQLQQRLWRVLQDEDNDLIGDVWEAYYGWLHRYQLSPGFSASTDYWEYVSFCENASDWNGNGVPAVMEAALGWDPLSSRAVSNNGGPEYFSHEAVALLRAHLGLGDIGAAESVTDSSIPHTRRTFYNYTMHGWHVSMIGWPTTHFGGSFDWVDSDWDGMHDFLEVWYAGGIEGEPEEDSDGNGARDIMDCFNWTLELGLSSPADLESRANGLTWSLQAYGTFQSYGELFFPEGFDAGDQYSYYMDPDGDSTCFGDEYANFKASCGFSAKDMYPVPAAQVTYLPNSLPHRGSPSGTGPRPWLVPPPPPSGQ